MKVIHILMLQKMKKLPDNYHCKYVAQFMQKF